MAFIESLRDCYLHQHVEEPTRRRGTDEPSLLDLVLTNEAMQVSDITHRAPIGKSDHDVILFNFHCYLDYSQPRDKFTFAKGDYDAMREVLRVWKEEFVDIASQQVNDEHRVEKCWRILKKKILELRDNFVPKSTVSNKPSWKEKGSFPINERERDAIREKNKKTPSLDVV